MEANEMNPNRLLQFAHDALIFIALVSVTFLSLVGAGVYQVSIQRAGSFTAHLFNAVDQEGIEQARINQVADEMDERSKRKGK